MNNEAEKPNLHQSMMNMFLRCGAQFEYRYIDGIKNIPGFALHIGSTLHNVQEHELVHKCNNDGQLIKESEALDVCRESFENNITEKGLMLNQDDVAIGEKMAKGKAIDTAISLAKLYHNQLAPIINPIDAEHVEMPWTVEWDGFSFNLSGTMDVVTAEGIRDLKTAGKTPSQIDVDNSDQLSMYATAYKALTDELPKSISYDALVKNKTPKIDIKTTTRSEDDIQRYMLKLSAFENAYKKGVFLPASQGWWCSKKFCGYYDMCKYSLNPKQFPVAKAVSKPAVEKPAFDFVGLAKQELKVKSK